MAIRFECSACNKTLQVADTAAGKKVACPMCQQVNQVPMATSNAPATAPAKPAPVANRPAPVVTPKPQAAVQKIAVQCAACNIALQVPTSAIGKHVRCPGCKGLIEVGPNGAVQPTPPQASYPQQPTYQQPVYQQPAYQQPVYQQPQAPMWNALNEIQPAGGGGGLDSFNWNSSGGGSSYGSSPYAAPVTRSSSRSYSGDRSPALYIIPGIFIILWSLLLVAGSVLRAVVTVYVLFNLPPNATIDTPRFIGGIVGLIIGFALGLSMLMGAIGMVTRNSLSGAKTAAVIAAIPCFGGLAFPFGIWACFLVFDKKAKKDFAG